MTNLVKIINFIGGVLLFVFPRFRGRGYWWQTFSKFSICHRGILYIHGRRRFVGVGCVWDVPQISTVCSPFVLCLFSSTYC